MCLLISMDLMRVHVYDPFLNTFSAKILESTWNEAYYFTYGFLRYHWLQIAKEYKKKTMFYMEWYSYAYNME